jgi:predicted O-methyltransferase YrrM
MTEKSNTTASTATSESDATESTITNRPEPESSSAGPEALPAVDDESPASRWAAIDDYLNALLLPRDEALVAALADSEAAGLPAISVAPNQGRLLQLLALMTGARSVLEIGTLGGYSTIWLCRGLGEGGRVITLELDPRHAAVAKANIERAGYGSMVDLRVGPARESLPQLLEQGHGPFDLVFIDADKGGYPDYLAWALRLARTGTVIVADNVVRKGAVADPESLDPNVVGVRRMLDLLASEPAIVATVIQTVGQKGHDGLAIGVVTADG